MHVDLHSFLISIIKFIYFLYNIHNLFSFVVIIIQYLHINLSVLQLQNIILCTEFHKNSHTFYGPVILLH